VARRYAPHDETLRGLRDLEANVVFPRMSLAMMDHCLAAGFLAAGRVERLAWRGLSAFTKLRPMPAPIPFARAATTSAG
jgi:hypothetical protein